MWLCTFCPYCSSTGWRQISLPPASTAALASFHKTFTSPLCASHLMKTSPFVCSFVSRILPVWDMKVMIGRCQLSLSTQELRKWFLSHGAVGCFVQHAFSSHQSLIQACLIYSALAAQMTQPHWHCFLSKQIKMFPEVLQNCGKDILFKNACETKPIRSYFTAVYVS